jgi:hypothetical protein
MQVSDLSVEGYLASMPGGSVLSDNWRDGIQRLVIFDGEISSKLSEYVREEFSVISAPDVLLEGFIVPPRIAKIILWEHENAVFKDEYASITDTGPLPAWGESRQEEAAELIVRCHDLSEPDLAARVQSAAASTGADVIGILRLVVENFWVVSDIDEYIEAVARALGKPSATAVLVS